MSDRPIETEQQLVEALETELAADASLPVGAPAELDAHVVDRAYAAGPAGLAAGTKLAIGVGAAATVVAAALVLGPPQPPEPPAEPTPQSHEGPTPSRTGDTATAAPRAPLATQDDTADPRPESEEVAPPQEETRPTPPPQAQRPKAHASTTAKKRSRPEAPTAPDAGALIRQARAARRAGDLSSAAEKYRAVLQHHAGSPSAAHARVALAELDLKAGRAAAALRGFQRYLSKSGAQAPLAPEARVGRVRALRALGKHAEARAAAAQALQLDAQSPYAAELRRVAKKPSAQ